MQYLINGKPVTHHSECGIYKEVMGGFTMEYATMDQALLAQRINDMPIDKAIAAVTALRAKASEQAAWEHTPQNAGYPILQQRPGPTPINEVRGNIQNTVRLCDDVLEALKGE